MQNKKRTVRRRGHTPYTKAHMGFRVRKNKTNRTAKYGNKKKTLKCQSGGGNIADIFFKKGTFSKNIYADSSPTTELRKLEYKRCQELPKIELKKNGKYLFEFTVKSYTTTQQSTSYGTQIGTQIAHITLERTGTIFHSIKTLKETKEKYSDIKKNYADDNIKKDFTLIINIYQIDNKTDRKLSNDALEKLYFNIKPI
jgi:hypothetical protein